MLPFELTKDTPYLALSGELWSVFYEYFNRNWPCYKGFLLYKDKSASRVTVFILYWEIPIPGYPVFIPKWDPVVYGRNSADHPSLHEL